MERPRILPLLSAVLVAAACGVPSDRIASVGSREILVTDLQAFLAAVTATPWQDVDPRVASTLLDQYLDQEVVAAAARKRAGELVPVEPTARSTRVRALLAEVCGASPQVDPETLQAEVDRRLTLVRPQRARVRQMLVESLELAEEAGRRLAGGESFEAVALELGRAPELGAEVGMVTQGSLPPELDEVVFSLAPGSVSAPMLTPSGYQILEVVEIVPAGPPGPHEAETAARRELAERQRRDFVRDCIARTAAELGVEVYPQHLWFEYRGRYAGGSYARS